MALTAIAVLLRILSNPLANVFQKQLTERSEPPLKVNFITFLLLSAVCIVPATRIEWAALPKEFWVWCTVAGIFGATGNGFLVKALQGGDLSVLGPINSYKSVVGMIAGILLQDSGRSVPGDVSLIGYDGAWFTQEREFSLTTVAQPVQEIGRSTYRRLTEILAGDSDPRQILLAPSLRPGASVAPPKTGK